MSEWVQDWTFTLTVLDVMVISLIAIIYRK